MSFMYKIQTKHLNEYSTLYGGQLLEWIDNYCLAKTERYKLKAGEKFVTRSISCEFLAPVYLGGLIKTKIMKEKIGNTSITFEYHVTCNRKVVAKGTTTFVKLYKGKKSKIIIKKKK